MIRYKVYTKEKGIVETVIHVDFIGLTWHREDGPAFIKYRKNGSIEYTIYLVNGKKHRLNGPTFIQYYDNGNIEREGYYINNIQNRLDGPADIWYNNDGNITYKMYYINGIEYTKKDYYNELLKLKLQSL